MTKRKSITRRITALALLGTLGFGGVYTAEAVHAETNRKVAAFEFECNADSCSPRQCIWIWGSYPGTGDGC